MKRLFLNYSTLSSRVNVDRALASCRLHPTGPLTINGEVIWKRDNLHLTWYRNGSGDYRGWRSCSESTADVPAGGWRPHVRPCRSNDGLAWIDSSDAGIAESVIDDAAERDPQRRFKCVYQGIAVLDRAGGVAISMDRYAELRAAAQGGEVVNLGMFSACSADGVHWHDHRPVVIDTTRVWDLAPALGHNTDGDCKQALRWWRPGEPGWSGGDSFPCLLRLPEQGKYVTFYRTNIDRRTSLLPNQRRRERGVGRSECTVFGEWGEHELAMRSDVDRQAALGYGKQDYYQLQVWPCADVYLGILSVFYWQEDRNHLELAWSPDSIYWERICPGHDLVPHEPLSPQGGGNRYAAMRPQTIDDQVRVYFGEDNGRHNANPERVSKLVLALFQPDRFAGLTTTHDGSGELTTVPLPIEREVLRLDADAGAGEIRVELQDAAGQPLAGYALEDCEPLRGDHAAHVVSWRGQATLPTGATVRLHLTIAGAAAYAFEV